MLRNNYTDINEKQDEKEDSAMKKIFGIVIVGILMMMALSSCSGQTGEPPIPTLSDPNEKIIYETVIPETIIWENVETETWN